MLGPWTEAAVVESRSLPLGDPFPGRRLRRLHIGVPQTR